MRWDHHTSDRAPITKEATTSPSAVAGVGVVVVEHVGWGEGGGAGTTWFALAIHALPRQKMRLLPKKQQENLENVAPTLVIARLRVDVDVLDVFAPGEPRFAQGVFLALPHSG